jgi:hypothetical protein
LRWIIDILCIDLIWRAMNALRSVFLVPQYLRYFDGTPYKVAFCFSSRGGVAEVVLMTAYFAMFVALAGRTPGMARDFRVRDKATRCPRTWLRNMTRASVHFLFLAILDLPSLIEIGGAPHTSAEYFPRGTPASVR